MSDLVFPDISEFQPPASDAYTGQWLTIRANDGTYSDVNFAQNYAWCVSATDRGQMAGFTVYSYWRPNAVDTAQTLINAVQAAGGPHPKMSVMCDLESGGNPGGNQGAGVEAYCQRIADWLGCPRDGSRVFSYGNQGDLSSMWPGRSSAHRVVVAGYGGPAPTYVPGFLAHQFTDSGTVPGFPPCDLNAANGMTASDFAAAVGTNTGGSAMAGYADWDSDSRDKFWADFAFTMTQPDTSVPPRRPDILGTYRDSVWNAGVKGVSAQDRLRGIDEAARLIRDRVMGTLPDRAFTLDSNGEPVIVPLGTAGSTPEKVLGVLDGHTLRKALLGVGASSSTPVDPKAVADLVVAALGAGLAAQVAAHLTVTATTGP